MCDCNRCVQSFRLGIWARERLREEAREAIQRYDELKAQHARGELPGQLKLI